MQSKISTPVAVILIVIVVAVAGFFLWKSQQAKSGNVVNEKGVPLPPPEAKPGANALADLYKNGVMPSKTGPAGR